jgi:hypothetical protein
MIRFVAETTKEVFTAHTAATASVVIDDTDTEPLVGLRNIGPNVHDALPKAGS